MARRDRGKASSDPGGTPAIRVLEVADVPFTVHPYEHDPRAASYGLEAAAALGVDPSTVFKTLVVQTDCAADHGLVVAVVPVNRQLDLKAVAAAARAKKATMADLAVVERCTGYVVGGVSPLGQKRPLRTYLDLSAEPLPRMYISGGRRGLDIGLRPADLARLTSGDFAPISR